MPVHNVGGQIKDGRPPSNQGGAEFTKVESAQAGQSSSVNSARHNGHTKAREHDSGYQPRRQAEQYSAGGV